MPYLSTSQEYLEQSALLLQAYPDTTRITSKYSFPSKSSNSKSTSTTQNDQQQAATAPIATLTMKTYNPTTGICLKFQTNKIQDVGRLMTSLGKLAGGADVAGLGLGASGPAQTAGGADTEMVDAPPAEEAVPAAAAAAAGKNEASKGGKSKKKGGKGKR